jgi:hypothetical protein
MSCSANNTPQNKPVPDAARSSIAAACTTQRPAADEPRRPPSAALDALDRSRLERDASRIGLGAVRPSVEGLLGDGI